jgi:hypothetical protein
MVIGFSAVPRDAVVAVPVVGAAVGVGEEGEDPRSAASEGVEVPPHPARTQMSAMKITRYRIVVSQSLSGL